ncbi:multiple coagulation factor deficiency protein 2 homolog [Parasteatoda tepidariorum]|nr:multiple coagulation factor deficiency protein 2 homolog [Parasteatoda tepidariorum]
MLLYWFHFMVFVIGSVSSDVEYSTVGHWIPGEDNDLDSRADFFKRKWGVEHVMRDLEHIKHDIKEMMDLKTTGKLSQLEMLFYMIRMHDFDNNGGLDGIEFRVALSHSLEHNTDAVNEERTAEKIEEMIENLMKVDDNNDGFINYGELRSHLQQEQREAEMNKKTET